MAVPAISAAPVLVVGFATAVVCKASPWFDLRGRTSAFSTQRVNALHGALIVGILTACFIDAS
jgi:hypothetical protein